MKHLSSAYEKLCPKSDKYVCGRKERKEWKVAGEMSNYKRIFYTYPIPLLRSYKSVV